MQAIPTFLVALQLVNGFVLQPYSSQTLCQTRVGVRLQNAAEFQPKNKGKSLSMSNEEQIEDVETKEEEDGSEETEGEEEEKEDPEIIALKDEISETEAALSKLRLSLSNLLDEAESYSEKGYLRKCAEMENVKRSRDQSSSNSRIAARALAVRHFVPALEELQLIQKKYAEEEFAKGYSALYSNFVTAFKDLEVSEYMLSSGDSAVDPLRIKVNSKEYSDTIPKDCVIRMEKSGLELAGNIIRPSECVISLGSEKEAIAEAEAKAAEEKAAKEAQDTEEDDSEGDTNDTE